MLFSELQKLVPEDVVFEVMFPGVDTPISFGDLPPYTQERITSSEVVQIMPLSFEWLGVRVK